MLPIYHPIQPTALSDKFVQYEEMQPHEELQHLVSCYWQLKTVTPLTSTYAYRVVADGCIDVFFELQEPCNSFITGFTARHIAFDLPSEFNYIGIRFLPATFPQLFATNASTLSNRTEQLQLVAPRLSKFISQNFHPRLGGSTIKDLLDKYLTLLKSDNRGLNDSRLFDALDIIMKRQGDLLLADDLDTGISQRQLRRLFDFYIGGSIKSFSKIIRFQNILKTAVTTGKSPEPGFYYDYGYFDQAHFIKDFKTLSGHTPSRTLQIVSGLKQVR